MGSNGLTATQRINKAWGDGTVTKSTAYRWIEKFEAGQEDFADDPRSGRPRDVNCHAIIETIEENPSMTTRMLAEDFGCSHVWVAEILKEAGKSHFLHPYSHFSLGKTWKKSRWVPHELSDEQKQRRVDMATALLERNNETPFLENIVTGDEKWVPFKNPDHHNQWLSPGQASTSTPKKDFRQEKRLLCVFWDRRHVIHWELLKKGQTVDAELYCDQLSRLHRKMRNRQGSIVLLHDNAKPHTARLTTNKMAEFGWEVLEHPPYSPDLAPSDFHLFRALEHFLRGKKFSNVDEMRVSLGEFFDSKLPAFYHRGIYLLPEKWQEVIDVDGEYFD